MKSFLARLYAYCFLRELILIYPFYAVMFVENGLSAVEVSILFAAWSGIVVVLEIPSGALADRFSRRTVLFSGQVLRTIGFLCWLNYPGFWGYLAGFLLWGTTTALASGAFEALIYDELVSLSAETEFVRVLGRARAFGTTGLIATSLSVIWLVDYGYGFLLTASATGALVSRLAILTLPSVSRTEKDTDRPYLDLLKEGVRHATENRAILKLIIFSAIAFSLPQSLDEYSTIFAIEVGLPKTMLGPLLAAGYLIQVAGSAIAYRFEQVGSRSYHAGVFLCGLLLLIAGLWAQLLSLVLIVLFVFIFEIINVLLTGKLQHSIPSHIRATISSVKGFGTEVTGILVFLGMGVAVGDGVYADGYVTFGWLIAGLGVIYWIVNPAFGVNRRRQFER